MKPYGKPGRDTGILSYESGRNWIKILYKGGDEYLYTYNSTGQDHIEIMKDLAEKGIGLSTYVSQNVKDLYDRITSKHRN